MVIHFLFNFFLKESLICPTPTGQQMFSIKGQRVNILGFVSHMVSVNSVKATTLMNGRAWFHVNKH